MRSGSRAKIDPWSAIFAFVFTSLADAATECYGVNCDETRCRHQVNFGSYCYSHTLPANNYAARIPEGSQGQNNATTGSSFCVSHLP